MRRHIACVLILFSFSLLSVAPVSTAPAEEVCRCKGCGCKGGPGWRGPDGVCVSQAKLAEICGSPAGVPCTQEAASRVCFGKQSAVTEPEARGTP